ncbi:phosphatase PAP2 family protein [Polaribacter porphyrae]|uniref:Phosphoesterase PA-phosphatase n=1 Tax=Polaribacter porphyrae TaxID=1137780 RepID=A0A2S7WLG4_9FLAO|nr:phosphatase PAP2 family protein [Polaribacter porphyrae]PQJ78455.1 phosphoesterase PA-phosphatase [Polaribacter porphyrae]
MRKTALTLILFFIFSQPICTQQNTSPYEWKWKRDGIWLGSGIAGTALGLSIIKNKEPFTDAEINRFIIQQDNINFLDRWVAGKYSETASKNSDIPFTMSFAAPLVLLLDDDVNNHTGQFMGMYLQALTTTSTLFTISAGITRRARPYVYNTTTKTLESKKRITATRSFFSGHVAATATASFFAAKVYQDYNPDSPAIPYIYAGAAILPATVGYFRMRAGQHFLTDVLVGYGIGALVGYYTPVLHQKKNESISLSPVMDQNFFGENYQAISLKYDF